MPADVAPEITSALRSGFASPTYVTAAELEEARDGEPRAYARLLGQCLAERAQMLWGASVGEYQASAASYDEIATAINTHFGANLASLSTDGVGFGIRD